MSAPTPEQEAAIAARGHDVLLEAGAGTGKTGVMVERYCRLVCEEGVAPDAVLAFTFTDKAAAELRQRIRTELTRRAEAGSDRARELLAGIGGAWVTTIHGFCNRLLASHPVAAGVDPRFRVLDQPEAERVAREAFGEALEEFLAGDDPARERTVAAYDIGGLRAIVPAAHAELRSRGVDAPRLPSRPEPDVAAAVEQALVAATETLAELKPGSANHELCERAIGVLGESGATPDLERLAALRSESSAQGMAAYREAIDAAVARSAEAGEGGETYGHLAALLELFSARFAVAKERRGAVDFEDLQILAARLLERTELGEVYRQRFEQILVDEFQDTNRLQLRLVEALRGSRTELVVVGDELQAIYGFRHADLDVFREQRAAIEASATAEAMALSGNFRSRPELIGAVNALGEKLLGDSYRPLRVGGPPPGPPPGDGPPVELLLTARDGWEEEGIELEPALDATTPANQLAEARFLAARLRALADAGVERGEMVVLLRAYTHLDAYEDSLGRAGLRPYVVGGRGYWSQQQVSDVAALLATIANPLDDQALFGALASPACGVSPDTLWLLRAASGGGRHTWPAIEHLAGAGAEAEIEQPDRLGDIPAAELELLRRFHGQVAALRERAPRLPLADLVDAAIGTTGYDLAVLMRPAGEARFANLRKLMRLAEEYEAREGRDLRGLLDFLATRAEADVEAQAATTVEGHDGVRIMTVHSAKGLEFGVVAVPQLSRRLLAGARTPPLMIGREPEQAAVGLQLRRLGAPSVNLYDFAALREEAQQREAEEELRLFHVAATRARERLILSGVVKPEAGGANGPGTPIVERLAAGFELDHEDDSEIAVPAPEPRAGLDAEFEPSRIAVRVNLPSPERAAELRARHSEAGLSRDVGEGPAPLVKRRPPTVPNRPLSYTALAAYEECPYRFRMERVLDLPPRGRHFNRSADEKATTSDEGRPEARRRNASARGAAVHSLLEWSAANEWREPDEEVVRSQALGAGLEADTTLTEALLTPVKGWLGSELLRTRIRADGATARAEVPLLLNVAGTALRGSIDLLVERSGEPPLVIDYKTDRLDGSSPGVAAAGYETQRAIYALAVAEARGVDQVEVAYVFLERADEPIVELLDAEQIAHGRTRLQRTLARIAAAEFTPAPLERRNWALCRGCPALGGLCSGPA